MSNKKQNVGELDVTASAGPVTALKNILIRIIAVFAASGLSVIGAGAIVGIDTATAVIMAGTLGVATVVEKLARSFIDDGKLSVSEINAAFNSVDKKGQSAN
jgi:hypothetical protein